MSARQGWQGTARIPTSPPTVSPNRQPDEVSAHVRVYWPHTATDEQILTALGTAWRDAVQGVKKMRDAQ